VSASALTGYNIYRSAGGASYSLLATVTGTTYDDAIDSSGDYGILYYYYVTAVAGEESDPSDSATQMYGTRLPALYEASSEYSLAAASSPYVLDGSSSFYADLTIPADTSLYFLPGSMLTMITTSTTAGEGPQLMCEGTIQSLGTAEHPVTMTCTQIDGSDPVNQTGFTPLFYSAVSWDSATGTGTMMRYTRMTNVRSYIVLDGTTAYLENCYFTTGPNDVASFVVSGTGNGTIVEHCLFTNMPLDIRADLRSSGFSFTQNRIRCSTYGWVMFFSGAVGQVLNGGQVSQNHIDGTKGIEIYNNTASVAIPLSGNYWDGGTPTVGQGTGVNATIDFTPALASAPTGAGPSW